MWQTEEGLSVLSKTKPLSSRGSTVKKHEGPDRIKGREEQETLVRYRLGYSNAKDVQRT